MEGGDIVLSTKWNGQLVHALIPKNGNFLGACLQPGSLNWLFVLVGSSPVLWTQEPGLTASNIERFGDEEFEFFSVVVKPFQCDCSDLLDAGSPGVTEPFDGSV
jgi:hypothetical protein